MQIPFNKPYLTGKETYYIQKAVKSGKISGNGLYTKKCQEFFVQRYGFQKALMTTSCTDALEMCAILLNIQPGDEVIVPSYTFVSTANAFVLRGAKIIFADSCVNNPNIDTTSIESLITPRTKAIVAVHYGGVACEMDELLLLSDKHHISLIEDAAQAIESFYKDQPLGSFGKLSAFSFHETKNIISGEGGLLAINDSLYNKRAEIIWEKGTNRAEFARGEANKYGWVDIGSSFLPSEITSAFLYAQLEKLHKIQAKRNALWLRYYINLLPLEQKGVVKLPYIPDYAANNGHLFYILCGSAEVRARLISFLRSKDILSVFHYLSLHKSPFYKEKHDGRELKNSDYFTDHLLRLPLFYELKPSQVDYICESIFSFFKQ
ncbi:MAG: dTDP-4-amino-4,6-dideoxygalactose transaminase [Bacteroidales bacterium]|nr:dTDP-4-amino-4,6-dideoxygalactose transaminase [Bacteroidales bacterium]